MPRGVLQRASSQAKTLTGTPQTPMPRGAANEQLTRAQGCSANGQPVGEGTDCNGQLGSPQRHRSPMPRGALPDPEASLWSLSLIHI
eukprot:2083930-Alexandrium_andersonii.AAC.1